MRGVFLRVALLAAVLAVVALPVSGCADGTDDPGEPGGPPTGTAGPTSGVPPGPVPPGRTSGAAEVTVRGTVVRGVEANCLVLSTGRREYLLVRAGPELRPGTEAVVRGTPRPGMPTTCMQGTPLVVTEADPVGGTTS